jgi:hypothetical protein
LNRKYQIDEGRVISNRKIIERKIEKNNPVLHAVRSFKNYIKFLMKVPKMKKNFFIEKLTLVKFSS